MVPKIGDRIVVGMSGGVDSAVTAYILKEKGYDVVGVFMRNWEETDENGVCTADEDFSYVRSSCDQMDIPYYTVNFAKQYMDRVFKHFLSEYEKGRTPNPDVLCNREIKFDEFSRFAKSIGAKWLATGHYVRVVHDENGTRLLKGLDKKKDQSYFLHAVSENQISNVLFPLGDMEKSEVRDIALKANLSSAKRKDSTGICFIGERDFKTFLQNYLPAQPGDIVCLDTGKKVGSHDGLMYYTLGQRKGIGIGGGGNGKPWFVAKKDLENNILFVVQGGEHPALFTSGCSGSEVTWISGKAPADEFSCTVKTRYRQPDQKCTVKLDGDRCFVDFEVPQRAVTPGQSLVFYMDDVCLGGAVID